MTTFASRIAGHKPIWMVTMDDSQTSERAWYYIEVDKLKLPLFETAVKQPFIDLNLYGTILERGWGEKPPEEMRKKYEN